MHPPYRGFAAGELSQLFRGARLRFGPGLS